MGIPCYFLFRNAIGINNAAVLMVLMMLPALDVYKRQVRDQGFSKGKDYF